jgi:hypothetical protein
MLANGHGDELLYERGMITTNLPLAELNSAPISTPAPIRRQGKNGLRGGFDRACLELNYEKS